MVFIMKKNFRYKAYERIKKKILYFELKPGEKIIESEITDTLKISRTPVREALLMLEGDGLIICDPNLGYMVRKVVPDEVNEYFEVRSLMEEFIAPLIIKNIKDSQIKTLEKVLIEAEKYLGSDDITKVMRYETEFHDVLYEATNSDVFLDTMTRHIYKFQWLRVIGLNSYEGAKQSFEDHKKMIAVIKRKDVDALIKIMKEHLEKAEAKCANFRLFF